MRASRVGDGAGRVYIGTSGWVYPSWREHLYQGDPGPALARASPSTASTRSRSTARSTRRSSRRRTSAGAPRRRPTFRFALKGHRFVTHYKRLRDVDDVDRAAARSGARRSATSCAAVVWQLPSNFAVDLAAPRRLPARAARVARGPARDRAAPSLVVRRRGRGAPARGARRQCAWATRPTSRCGARSRPTWSTSACTATPASTRRATARRTCGAGPPTSQRWAAEGRDVHVYFDNDAEGHAVRNALTLRDARRDAAAAPRARTPRAVAFQTSPRRGRARAAPSRPRPRR